ncbi:hypothetical protein BASA81_002273 [Batrachochytrium salamandrivorans]|nr:hypothetical protein BASA81_002273 [Batrachochytrium salamandrivorans]
MVNTGEGNISHPAPASNTTSAMFIVTSNHANTHAQKTMRSIAERIAALTGSQSAAKPAEPVAPKPATATSGLSMAEKIARLKATPAASASDAPVKQMGMGDMLKMGASSGTSSRVSSRIASLQSSLPKEEVETAAPPAPPVPAPISEADAIPAPKQMGMGDLLGSAKPLLSSSSSSSLIASRIASLQSETILDKEKEKLTSAAAKELENAPVLARPVIPSGKRRLPSIKPAPMEVAMEGLEAVGITDKELEAQMTYGKLLCSDFAKQRAYHPHVLAFDLHQANKFGTSQLPTVLPQTYVSTPDSEAYGKQLAEGFARQFAQTKHARGKL